MNLPPALRPAGYPSGRFLPPLALLAGTYAAGCLAGTRLTAADSSVLGLSGPGPFHPYLYLAASVAAAAGGLLLLTGRRGSGVLLLVALFMAATVAPAAKTARDRGNLAPFLDRTVTLVGTVAAFPERDGARERFVLRAEGVRLRGEEIPVRGRVQVTVFPDRRERVDAGSRRDGTGSTPAAGDGGAIRFGHRVTVTGRLVTPRGASNPGEFDYRAYLARRGLPYVVSVSPGTVQVVGVGRVNPLSGLAMGVREGMTAAWRRHLTTDQAALLEALLFGVRDSLPPQVRTGFSEAGLLHLLAVSGLHVGLVAGAVLGLLYAAGLPARTCAGAGVPFIFLYALMTGGRPPVWRAALMAGAALMAVVTGRGADGLNLLGLAAFILLVLNPWLLLDVSFQLSFVATLSILVLTPPVSRCLSFLPPWLRLGLAAGLSAQLGTVPIIASHFYRLSPLSAPATVAVLPLVTAAAVLGLAAGVTGMVWPSAGAVFSLPNGAVLSLLGGAVSFVSGLPASSLAVPPPGIPVVVTYYLGIIILVAGTGEGGYRPSGPGRQSPGRPGGSGPGLLSLSWLEKAVALSVLVALVITWSWFSAGRPGEVTVTFLAVGQGDAAFLHLPGGKTMLIDGGGQPGAVGTDTGPPFDVGARTVVPFLRGQGVRRLDYVVLSHPHEDHVGGLPAVLEAIPVREVWDSGYPHPSPGYERFLDLVRARRIPYINPRRGDRFRPERDVEVKVLHPGPDLVRGSRDDVNNNSLVLMVRYRRVAFLFAGDIEQEGEKDMLAGLPGGPPDPDVTLILKVPHHGSRNSTGEDLLDAFGLALRHAVIPVGEGNRYGFPHPELLTRLRDRGIEAYRTDLHGAVTIATDGYKVRIRTFRGGPEESETPASPASRIPARITFPDPCTITGSLAGA